MRRVTSFRRVFTTLPRRANMVIATMVTGLMTHYVGLKTIKKMQDTNVSANMDRLRSDPPDWSCFYYAKQYREECSDYNRLAGGDYIDRVCANLEAKLHACEQNLAKEIANCQPYAEDAPIEVENMQPWLRRPAGIRSA